jgi:serine/threonine protein kinase
MLGSLFGGKKPQASASDIALEMDFSLKTIFKPQFGLTDLDLLETIGTGTFARVRLARSVVDRKYYALKMVKKSRVVKFHQLEHLQNEVKILSRIRCPYVPELFAVFQDDVSLYILIEYIQGGELFSHLRRQVRFDFPQYQFVCVEIACALRHLHMLDILYRDIKPENILYTKDGHIRLVDFGFAKVVTEKTYTLCGTPEYLAPEVLQGAGYGQAVDWWMLGALCFEMACGYPPFYGESPFLVYKKILEGKYSFPSGMVPKPAQIFINGCLNSNRANRLGSGSGGFSSIKNNIFFLGIEWNSAAMQLMMPPTVPTVRSDGDSSNYDFFAEESVEEPCNLTKAERESFKQFDIILERPIQS